MTAASAPTSSLIIPQLPRLCGFKDPFAIPNVTFTSGGSLIVYVGTAAGSGDSISMSGNGNNPGIAVNLQIFGLPSVNTFTVSGNACLVAAIYAPEAKL